MFGIAEPWSWVALDYLRHTGETSVLSRSFTSHGVRAEPAAGALDASRLGRVASPARLIRVHRARRNDEHGSCIACVISRFKYDLMLRMA